MHCIVLPATRGSAGVWEFRAWDSQVVERFRALFVLLFIGIWGFRASRSLVFRVQGLGLRFVWGLRARSEHH